MITFSSVYRSFIGISIALTTNVNAGIFGPNSYEDCLDDMLKSAKNYDLPVANLICRNKFPKLVNLSNKKDTNLSCEDSNKKNVYHIKIKSGKVSIQENKKVNFEITSFTRESFTFKGFSTDSKDEKRKIKIFGNINPATSFGRITVEYVDGITKDFTYEFSCVEE